MSTLRSIVVTCFAMYVDSEFISARIDAESFVYIQIFINYILSLEVAFWKAIFKYLFFLCDFNLGSLKQTSSTATMPLPDG